MQLPPNLRRWGPAFLSPSYRPRVSPLQGLSTTPGELILFSALGVVVVSPSCFAACIFQGEEPSGWILCLPPKPLTAPANPRSGTSPIVDIGKPLEHHVQVLSPTVYIAVLQSGIFRACRGTTGSQFLFFLGGLFYYLGVCIAKD